jgi:4-diphosphocytidyl-2-C-methyl-D-erythritol kinase
LGLTESQLIERAARLGADCAFFVLNRPAYAEGIGERLVPVELSLKGLYMVVVRPDIPVPTKEAFSLIHPMKPKKNCLEIVQQPVDTWRKELVNDFEHNVFALHPEIAAIKERLYQLGAVYAAMSGSGSAVFGLFNSQPHLHGEFPGLFQSVMPL